MAYSYGCACETDIAIIQRFQNKSLRTIVNAPWHVRNYVVQRNLQTDKVKAVIQQYLKSHLERLGLHINQEASNSYSRIEYYPLILFNEVPVILFSNYPLNTKLAF